MKPVWPSSNGGVAGIGGNCRFLSRWLAGIVGFWRVRSFRFSLYPRAFGGNCRDLAAFRGGRDRRQIPPNGRRYFARQFSPRAPGRLAQRTRFADASRLASSCCSRATGEHRGLRAPVAQSSTAHYRLQMNTIASPVAKKCPTALIPCETAAMGPIVLWFFG
jgi:hypothetical protein